MSFSRSQWITTMNIVPMVTAGSRGRKGNVNRIIRGMNRKGWMNQLHLPTQPGCSNTTFTVCLSAESYSHLNTCPVLHFTLLQKDPRRWGPHNTTELMQVTEGVLSPHTHGPETFPRMEQSPYNWCSILLSLSDILTINEEEAQKFPEHKRKN